MAYKCLEVFFTEGFRRKQLLEEFGPLVDCLSLLTCFQSYVDGVIENNESKE